MYRQIVRRKVEQTFAAINAGDYMAMVDSLADEFTYHFHGDTALGGTRTTRTGMELWWQRIMRLLPDAKFQVQEVLVNGPPWRTRIAVRLHVRGTIPGSADYENTVFQFMTLRWGRVAAVETLEDLLVLQRALSAVAAAGQPEAVASPISDDAGLT